MSNFDWLSADPDWDDVVGSRFDAPFFPIAGSDGDYVGVLVFLEAPGDDAVVLYYSHEEGFFFMAESLRHWNAMCDAASAGGRGVKKQVDRARGRGPVGTSTALFRRTPTAMRSRGRRRSSNASTAATEGANAHVSRNAPLPLPPQPPRRPSMLAVAAPHTPGSNKPHQFSPPRPPRSRRIPKKSASRPPRSRRRRTDLPDRPPRLRRAGTKAPIDPRDAADARTNVPIDPREAAVLCTEPRIGPRDAAVSVAERLRDRRARAPLFGGTPPRALDLHDSVPFRFINWATVATNPSGSIGFVTCAS